MVVISVTAKITEEDISDFNIDNKVLGFDITQVSTLDYRDLRQQVALRQSGSKDVSEVFDDPNKIEIYEYYMDHKKVQILRYTDEDEVEHKGIESDFLHKDSFGEDHRKKVVEDIKNNWTHLSKGGEYSALLATSSRKEAIEYYQLLKEEMRSIKTTVLFDSNLDESAGSIKIEDGLAEIIADYNKMYNKNYTIATHHQFKQDLSQRLAQKGVYQNIKNEDKVHLVVVVDQLLTGYDSKWINTLYFDKLTDYHNIIQAFSRTNRLNRPTKPFGSIRYYRRIYEMEQNINDAVKSYSGDRGIGLFADKLGSNLTKMNRITEDIYSVFSVENIKNFEKLPDNQESQGKFAQLFVEFNEHLEAALIQGFSWEQSEYVTPKYPNEPPEKIAVLFTQEVYDAWFRRYEELSRGVAEEMDQVIYHLKSIMN